MEFINRRIYEEISRKLGVLQAKGSCRFNYFLDKRHLDHIEKDAILHSYKIEHPNENITRFSAHINRREKKKGVKNLEKAFRWATTNFSPQRVTEDYVKEVAGMTDPDFHNYLPAEYRTIGKKDSRGIEHLSGVRAGQNFTPPYPQKIPGEMEKFTLELENIFFDGSLFSLLEGSIYSHLHIARIHPFEDTNGRTARTFQNSILKYAGLPPPIIYAGERFDYYEHLENACLGHRSRMADPEKKRNSEGESSFYNYLAGKISASLDRALDK